MLILQKHIDNSFPSSGHNLIQEEEEIQKNN